jgi:hypothetical protein
VNPIEAIYEAQRHSQYVSAPWTSISTRLATRLLALGATSLRVGMVDNINGRVTCGASALYVRLYL